MAAPRSSAAGGALIAGGAIAGTVIGVILREVTASFLIGTGLGIAASLLLWWADRRRG